MSRFRQQSLVHICKALPPLAAVRLAKLRPIYFLWPRPRTTPQLRAAGAPSVVFPKLPSPYLTGCLVQTSVVTTTVERRRTPTQTHDCFGLTGGKRNERRTQETDGGGSGWGPRPTGHRLSGGHTVQSRQRSPVQDQAVSQGSRLDYVLQETLHEMHLGPRWVVHIRDTPRSSLGGPLCLSGVSCIGGTAQNCGPPMSHYAYCDIGRALKFLGTPISKLEMGGG